MWKDSFGNLYSAAELEVLARELDMPFDEYIASYNLTEAQGDESNQVSTSAVPVTNQANNISNEIVQETITTPNQSTSITQTGPPDLTVTNEEFDEVINDFQEYDNALADFEKNQSASYNPNLVGNPSYVRPGLARPATQDAYNIWKKGGSNEEIKKALPNAEEALGVVVDPRTGERLSGFEATFNSIPNFAIDWKKIGTKLMEFGEQSLYEMIGPEWADLITSLSMDPSKSDEYEDGIKIKEGIGETKEERDARRKGTIEKFKEITGWGGAAPAYIDPETNKKIRKADNPERWEELNKISGDIQFYDEAKEGLGSGFLTEEQKKLLKDGPTYKDIKQVWDYNDEEVGKSSASYGVEKYIEEIIKLDNERKHTGPGLEKAIKNRSIAQFIPAVASAFEMVTTSVLPTVVATGATMFATRNPVLAGRVGQAMIGAQIAPEMWASYNEEKAARLNPGLSRQEQWKALFEQKKQEFAIPLALSYPAMVLEKIGIKGITKAINKGAYSGKGLVTSLWAAGGETGTELAQLPLDLYNTALGKGLKGDKAAEFVWEGIKEQGVETALQSFVGTLLFTGGSRIAKNGFKAMINHAPGHTKTTATNSLMNIGILKQNMEMEKNPSVKQGIKKLIKLETEYLRGQVKEGEDLGRRLTPEQLTRSANAQKTIDTNTEQLNKLKNDFDTNKINEKQYQEGSLGYKGEIAKASGVINRIVEKVKTDNQPIIRNKNGSLNTRYTQYLEEVRKETETRTTIQQTRDELQSKQQQLQQDKIDGIIDDSQYQAELEIINQEANTKISNLKKTLNTIKKASSIKESSKKASEKLTNIWNEGVKDGGITTEKDKKGKRKNVISSKVMKEILKTQAPFIKQLSNLIYNAIPRDKRIGSKTEYESNIKNIELLDLLRTYDGSVPLGAYIQTLLHKRAKSKRALANISNQQFSNDIASAEVQGMISEENMDIDPAINNIDTARKLGVSKNLLGVIKNVAKKALLTAQEKVDNIKFKSDIAKSFKDDLYSTIKKELGLKNTKKNPGLTKAIEENPSAFYDSLSVESMRKARGKDENGNSINPFEAAVFLKNVNGVLEKVPLKDLGVDGFLAYITAPEVANNTRSDRQMHLIEALAVSMGAREAISLLENDIEFRERFAEQQQKDIFQEIVNKIKSIPKGLTEKLVEQLQEISSVKNVGDVIKLLGLTNKITVTDSNRVAKQKANLKAIKKGKIPSIVFISANFSNFKRKTVYGHYDKNKKFVIVPKNKRNKKIDKKYVVTTSNEYILESSPQGAIEAKLDNGERVAWQTARGSLYYGVKDPAYITALEAAQKNDKEYKNLKKALKVTISKGEKITKKFIEKYQQRAKDNMDALESFATILQDAVHEYKVPLEDVLLFVSSSYQATSGIIKIAAPFKYVSKKFEYDLKGKLSDRTGEKYREEHNPPASVIGGTLMWAIANNKVGVIMPSIKKNYYQTQLSKKDDGKIDRAKLADVLPKGFSIIDNPIVRLDKAKIDLNSIVNILTGETLAQENNVESPNTIDGIAASNDASIANNSDQVENLIDRAISKLTELTGSQGTLQMNLGAIPVNLLIGGLRAVKLAYQGGKTLAQAMEQGYKKIKDYMSAQEWADFVSQSTQEVRNENNPAQVKLAILSEKGVAQMQEQSRKTDNALLKEFGIDIEGLTTDEIVEKLNILRKAKSEASNPKNPTKKARVFDFDDTLAKTKSNVLYTLPDGTEYSLNATEFAEQYESLKQAGAIFDYSEFNKVKDGTKGPLATLAKRFTEALGDRDVFVLTARPAEAAVAIQEFLRNTLGISIPLKNIAGIENGTPGAKAMWIAEKVSEGYNDIFFADDSKSNVAAVEKMLTDLGVTNRVQQAKEDGQKTLEDEMDSLIRTNKPSKIGRILNKLNIYIPPGADDFAGLLSYFLGSGKTGEQQQKWFQENLLDPFAKGIDAWTAAKVSLAQDYKELKKRFKNKKILAEKVLGGLYTKEQAVRAYLYNKAGQDLGLNKADTQDLIDLVEGNAELKAFADELSKITKLENGYPNITKEWLGGNIDTDIANAANTSLRELFLQDFVNNKNQIFSEQNLKLIKQAYGNDFANALENILERMTTGINRKKGKDKEFNSVMNWINQSVGAVMAVNMRSAILQQLSIVNYTNWSFNNPFMMAKAMANVPQFLKDYAKIWNSPFLKERRGGMAIEVNMADIADSNPSNLFLRLNKKLLELGFKPTQWGDSNAISFGGATWYRNRLNQLLKEGTMTEKEADKQVMLELRELSEEHQQSSRPDRISRQQSSDIGRLILAFANTPLQLARSHKKAIGNLIYRRGDAKTNMSKAIYYGVAQSIIFVGLQQGLFSLLADDDDELDEKEKKKLEYALHSGIDGLLRGIGFAGATTAALKSLAMEYYAQYQKRKEGKYVRDGSLKLIQRGLSISPPLSKKIGDIVEAQKFETWRQYKNDPFYKGFAAANYVSGLTNIPADRVFKKIENLKAASDDKTEAWQSVFLALGWSPYNVGMQWPEIPPKKKKTKKPKLKKLKKPTPMRYELPQGVLGRANKDGTIEIKKGLSKEKEAEVEAHEKVHLQQFADGSLDYNDEYIRWKNQQALRTADRKIFWNGKLYKEGDKALPWEIEANKLSKQRTV